GRSAPVPNGAGSVAARMRVADLDGDGFDDIVLSYPGDASGDGRIYLYFGASGGLANAAAPLALSGRIAGGLLGYGQAFDVGDFDDDGKTDIAAAATDCASVAELYIWTGAAIAAARAAGGAPARQVYTSVAGLVGGTVRAVGHATGGAAPGDDLLVSAYTAGCGSSSDFSLAILPRGMAWQASNLLAS